MRNSHSTSSTRLRRTDRKIGRVIDFLRQIWALHPLGFVFLAARTDHGRWIENGFHVKFGWHAIERFLREYAPNTHDLYYCPNAFSQRKRLAELALPTQLAWCDIDGADPGQFDPPPNVLIETSPRRYQGLWIFSFTVERARAEAVSKYLTNTYHGDPGGWSITKMLRLPGTINHKPEYDSPIVAVVRNSKRFISKWPRVTTVGKRIRRDFCVNPTVHDPEAVIRKYRKLLKPNRARLMRDTAVGSRDRSKIIFMIVAALHEVSAKPDEIAAVVWRSPYFLSKHGAHLDPLNAEINRILSKLESHDEI